MVGIGTTVCRESIYREERKIVEEIKGRRQY
jgi:hypothetical protein